MFDRCCSASGPARMWPASSLITLVRMPRFSGRRTVPSSHRFARPMTMGMAGPVSGSWEMSNEVSFRFNRTRAEVSPSKIAP